MGNVRALRYRYPDGTVQAVLPMHVVKDDDRELVGWTPNGTEIRYWATADGRDPRHLPLHERFRGPLSSAASTWKGSVLRVIPYGEPFQVLHFWDEDGEFACWYINLETRKTRVGHFVDSVDLHLDLIVDASGDHRWKDADEAVAALGTAHLDAADLIVARDAVVGLLSGRGALMSSVGDWRAFQPDAAWQVPLALPADWRT
jgi:hypothetical protein